MAVKRIRSQELEIAKKNNKTLEDVCLKYGVEPDEGLTEAQALESLKENFKTFCVKRGITEDAAIYFIGAFADNSKKAKRKTRKKKEKLEDENNQSQEETENLEIPESPEVILENLKKDLDSMNQENCQELIEKIQGFMLDFEIKVEEFQAQKERINEEASDLATEIKGLEEQLSSKKSAYDELNFNGEVLQESINSNNKFISQFKELVELGEEKKRMLNPDLLVVDADFDVSSVSHGKEVSVDEFSYSDEEYKEKIAQIMQLADFDDLSMKQIKMYAKILIVLDIYSNNEKGVSLVLGINEKDKANIIRIQEMLKRNDIAA